MTEAPREAKAYPNVGFEQPMLEDWFDTLEYAVDLLRSGSLRLDGSRDPATLNALSTCLIHLVSKLQPRLDGTIDALLVAQRLAGGSWNELSRDTEEAIGTLRSRVKKIETDGSYWAKWARGELNPHHERYPVELTAPTTDWDTDKPVGALLAYVDRLNAQDAADERAGKGVRLGREGVEFQLGEAGRDFLSAIAPLRPPTGPIQGGVRSLDPELVVQLVPAYGVDGWWHLQIPPHSSRLAQTYMIEQADAARLLAAATADPIIPGRGEAAGQDEGSDRG
ncbi:hypothetical protein ACFV9C_42195 [Kribbella sp. NPDC059898]|uniref:hypothetical protein n=1 Tax=Kribbella sp. NPDC059898 TaxID=3346995 RepID=UPI00365538CD